MQSQRAVATPFDDLLAACTGLPEYDDFVREAAAVVRRQAKSAADARRMRERLRERMTYALSQSLTDGLATMDVVGVELPPVVPPLITPVPVAPPPAPPQQSADSTPSLRTLQAVVSASSQMQWPRALLSAAEADPAATITCDASPPQGGGVIYFEDVRYLAAPLPTSSTMESTLPGWDSESFPDPERRLLPGQSVVLIDLPHGRRHLNGCTAMVLGPEPGAPGSSGPPNGRLHVMLNQKGLIVPSCNVTTVRASSYAGRLVERGLEYSRGACVDCTDEETGCSGADVKWFHGRVYCSACRSRRRLQFGPRRLSRAETTARLVRMLSEGPPLVEDDMKCCDCNQPLPPPAGPLTYLGLLGGPKECRSVACPACEAEAARCKVAAPPWTKEIVERGVTVHGDEYTKSHDGPFHSQGRGVVKYQEVT